MTLLLPSLQSERVRGSVVDYLSTAFALTDAEPRAALTDFLSDREQGVFVGPYVRLRLPYLPTGGRSEHLSWDPGLTPYRHQAEAYARLTSKDGHVPQPTIVTTGTGSGKTEAFLHPVIDHVLRAQAAGVTGVKALILYPMNALATDQAGRLARTIAGDPALAGVRAGLFTGDTTGERTRVTADSLITSRHAIRENPPDILLTNYKMLDELLLRPEDARIWRESAASLTYLVLDEVHTYDGAQGTDVAMLLRRLGLTLRAHLESDDPRRAAYDARPLGPVCPVATSATLGDGGDPSRMLAFARDVFGTDLAPDAVVTETRTSLEDWAAPHLAAAKDAGLTGRERHLRILTGDEVTALARAAEEAAEPNQLLEAAVEALYEPDALSARLTAQARTELLVHAVQAHSDVHALITAAEHPTALSALAVELFGPTATEDAEKALNVLLATLSTIRSGLDGTPDRSAVSVDITLWIREITRVDRTLEPRTAFRWADAAPTEDEPAPARPALYCRSCGRSGWGITLASTGEGEKTDQSNVRRDRLRADTRFRAILAAPGEDLDYRERHARGETGLPKRYPGLRWYSLAERALLTRLPDDTEDTTLDGGYLPVLVLTGDDKTIAKDTTEDVCPSCGARDSIRFLGSSVATLLSVSLTTLFGDDHLDDVEKRALVFTDSVQDAAHRAGFVDQRSHTMSLRAALRHALTGAMPVDAWVDAALDAARNDEFDRYRLVPSALAEHEHFRPYWDTSLPGSRSANIGKARPYVRRRLAFDTELEVGLQSTYGRTLESTGSVSVHVHAGSAATLAAIARSALRDTHQDTMEGEDPITEAHLLRWVRGTLEHMRRDGAIDHEWLDKYKKNDGERLWIWGRRQRNQGQPSFPKGRSAPAFPEVDGKPDTRRSSFVPVRSPQSWYATWARKCLPGTSRTYAARLAEQLLRSLEEAGVLTATPTVTGGTVYGIPSGRVVVTPLIHGQGAHAVEHRILLVCDSCRTQLPAAEETVDQLEGAPCFSAACPGHLAAALHPAASFYRDLYAGTHVRRVDAHEHTSLLDSKERERVEQGFKRAEQRPGDPNVLVATPTLEMGIDIGDLSTVMLASLPSTVASYVQRVGRAGRRNGSSLALAYVPGRRDQLPHLDAPERLLDGSVAPPATYLGAEEILRRQFIASVIDLLTREGDPSVPAGGHLTGTARTALSGDEHSLLPTVANRITRDGPILVAAFSRTFSDATPALERLASWVTDEDGEGPRTLLQRAIADHKEESEDLRRQRLRIQDALGPLADAANESRPNVTDEDRQALRSAKSALIAVERRLADLEKEHWVSALERRGILPNFALIDDTVQLSARVSWRDPETDEFRTEPCDVDRASAHALSELAPGATFYTHGMEMNVDGLEATGIADQAEWWFVCEQCGYVDVRPPAPHTPAAPSECPRCHDTAISESGRARRVMRLTHVFADVNRDDARIGDAEDDRTRTRFEVHPLADLDPAHVQREWSVEGSGFGVTRYRDITLRWLNTGKSIAGVSDGTIAGQAVGTRGFRLCDACGKLDSATGTSSPREHRPWCEHRNDPAEHVTTLSLMRSLTTEAVALALPPGLGTDQGGQASLAAAILLGIDMTTGSVPDHLGVLTVPQPASDGEAGETLTALLLHDTVPGGTGYLTDLDQPERLWHLLVTAGQCLEGCECQHEGKALCHRCLEPYAATISGEVTRAAALYALRRVLAMPNDASFHDVDEDAASWTVTNTAVASRGTASPLEADFRVSLTALLETEVEVATVSDPSGQPGLSVDGGTWRIRPQIDAMGSRPDFTCLSSDGRPSVAVFTDGYTFHATRAHNRIADDASKRAQLRLHGYRVISLSTEDLTTTWEPDWLSDTAVTALIRGDTKAVRAGEITTAAVEIWRGGPLRLLTSLLLEDTAGSSRVVTALAALADSSWGPLAIGIRAHATEAGGLVSLSQGTVPGADLLWETVRAAAPDLELDEPEVGEPDFTAVFSVPHLAIGFKVAARRTREIVLVIDDRDSSLELEDHKAAWQAWLRLSNVLAFAEDALVTITTTSLAVEELRDRAALEVVTAGSGVTPQQLTELGWDAVDRDPELTPAAIIAMMPLLAAAGVRAGEYGTEQGDGVPTELAWPEQHVALVYEPFDGDEAALEDDGWTVVVQRESSDPSATAHRLIELLTD